MISIPGNKEYGNQNFPVEQQTWRKQIHPSRIKIRKQTKLILLRRVQMWLLNNGGTVWNPTKNFER